MKILIIEDEARAANQLQKMLASCAFDYELLDIIDSVEDAIQWFRSKQFVDLVFMDIQLADGLSFEIFKEVEVEAPIIFTTAFDQYAIQAFKVNSVDYLLKPIQQDDLSVALDQFKKSTKGSTMERDQINRLLASMQMINQRSGILVKEGNAMIQLRIADLLYVYSEDSITFGVTMSKRYIIDETLDKLFETLDKQQFFKINRGQIISKQAIQKISPYLNHRLKLSMLQARDQAFVVSRQKTADFKQWMNQ